MVSASTLSRPQVREKRTGAPRPSGPPRPELENNTFAQLVTLNTDVKHLPADFFQTPAFTLEVDQSKQFTGLSDATHIGNADPTGGISINGVEILPLVVRDNPGTPGPDANYLHCTGKETVVLGGTEGNDLLIARSSATTPSMATAATTASTAALGTTTSSGAPGTTSSPGRFGLKP